MTRSELIVALLDMAPSDEDIVLEFCEPKGGPYHEFTIDGPPITRQASDGWNQRIVLELREI